MRESAQPQSSCTLLLRALYGSDHLDAVSEFKTRTGRALNRGRITDRTPNYIGTSELGNPSQGLFEMFIEQRNGRQISGRIEDIYGSARFEGIMRGNRVYFWKQYDATAISIGARKDTVHYRGTQTDGKTSGTYWREGSNGPENDFVMKAFDPKAEATIELSRLKAML